MGFAQEKKPPKNLVSPLGLCSVAWLVAVACGVNSLVPEDDGQYRVMFLVLSLTCEILISSYRKQMLLQMRRPYGKALSCICLQNTRTLAVFL